MKEAGILPTPATHQGMTPGLAVIELFGPTISRVFEVPPRVQAQSSAAAKVDSNAGG